MIGIFGEEDAGRALASLMQKAKSGCGVSIGLLMAFMENDEYV